jgi:hypothetical protein
MVRWRWLLWFSDKNGSVIFCRAFWHQFRRGFVSVFCNHPNYNGVIPDPDLPFLLCIYFVFVILLFSNNLVLLPWTPYIIWRNPSSLTLSILQNYSETFFYFKLPINSEKLNKLRGFYWPSYQKYLDTRQRSNICWMFLHFNDKDHPDQFAFLKTMKFYKW